MICSSSSGFPWRLWGASAPPRPPAGKTPTRALFRRPETSSIDIEVDGAIYPVRLRRNRRARRYTLQIHPTAREAVLTLPPRGTLKDARDFAARHAAWVAMRLKRLPAAAPFAHGVVVPLRGVPHAILHRPGARGTVWTGIEQGEPVLCVAGESAHLGRRLRDFLKREVRRDLEAAVRKYTAALGVAYARISVRDTSSRWGSCSSTGTLSFSWRLIFAPPEVLDYLAAHEVAHLVEMNHSRAFWRLVMQMCPHARFAKDWLNSHGADLHRYGADM